MELMDDARTGGLRIVLISHNMLPVFEVAARIHIHRLDRHEAGIEPEQYTMTGAIAIMTNAMVPNWG